MAGGGAGPLGAYAQEMRRFQRSVDARRARRAAQHSAMRKAAGLVVTIGGENNRCFGRPANFQVPVDH